MKKILKWILISITLLGLIVAGVGLWLLYGSKTSNPNNYKTIGEIPTPWGYTRLSEGNMDYTNYLRSLPLKSKGSKLELYTGGNSRLQSLNYAVIDLPLLSNAEQCADVCMRLRSEYLYQAKKYQSIAFHNVNGQILQYKGGASRKAFESYLRNLYGVASTFSLSR